MRFTSEAGYPTEEGATTWGDSARLAGMMALVNHPKTPDLRGYVDYRGGCRCPAMWPERDHRSFTRDQLLPLAAGLCKQGALADTKYLYLLAKKSGWRAQNTHTEQGTLKPWYNGPDWLSPSDRSHLAECAEFTNVHTLGKDWLRMEIQFNAKFTPEREPNQLIAKCYIARELAYYVEHTPRWREAVMLYWGGWRAEPELGQMIIKLVEDGARR